MGETMTAAELAALLCLSERTLRELATRGIVEKVDRNAYSVASVARYCEHLRAQAAGRAGEAQAGLTAERARQAKEQADNVALKNAEKRGELIPASAVEAEWSSILRSVRARLLAAPSRIRQRLPHLTAHDAETMEAEIRDALTELARDDRTAA